MPPSAATESHIAAQSSAASNTHTHTHSHSHTHASHPDHDPAESSDAETEPLPYDDAAEEDRNSDIVMDPNELAHHTRAVVDTDADAPGEEIADVSMEHSIHDQQESSQAEDLADHPDDDEDDEEEEDEDGEGEDALPASQATATHDPNSNMSSPQKTGAFTGDEFSDESELTDEDEDQNEDEDASSLSDDDLGGSDDEDEEDEEDDDPDSKTHEDEAAEALAALTGGADSANDDASAAAAGLDALAMLATAGDAEADHGDEDEEDEDDQASDAEGEDANAAGEAGASLDEIAKHARLQQLRQEADGDDLSSDITPEPEDGEIDGAAGADDGSDQEDDATPRDTDLDLIASMKKRAAATGGATSLLEPEQLVDSLPGSAASSRAASPLGDEDEDADKAKSAEDHEGDADAKAPEAEQAEAEHLHTAAGTPAPDAAEHDEDTSTDEAAIRRQEAMEALTKIEIGFAMLRDRLYVERLQEISKEGDMILDGTHPELLHLTKAIEMRRQRRTQLVEMWFEQQEQQYERVAKAEEFAAWSIWRSSCASLRRDMMDEFSRKRRRLDREKRTLDAPRPARRHQIFETELVRNPDRLHIPLEPSMTAEEAERGEANGNKSGRKASAKRKALAREIEAGDEFVAYPDLKGLAEADVMMDIEQMGIRPVGVPPGMYDPFYGPPVGLEFQNPDVYAMYGPEAAAAAAAAAQAHMNGFPYGLPPGARGLPPPPPGMMAPGTPGSAHTPHRHGMHPLPPPPGHMHPMEMGMMPFDPYAAAEMERAARMHHREQQARMGGMDPNDPHHRSSPFPPDMYPPPYPPHFNLPPGAAGGGPGGPGMGGGGRGGMPTSPTPPRRKERASLEESVSVSGRGRGAAKTSGRSSKQSRSSQAPSAPPREGHMGAGGASPSHTKTKTNLPPPPSMSSSTGGLVDEREHKPTSNGAAARGPSAKQSQGVAGIKGMQQQQPPHPAAATPVAVAASAGVANARLYPPSQTSTKSS
ncbi:uncharacterized protein UTRI_06119 [Ustilago trichophora]|uniref:Uncharacterized protein n=1 Tax=Ustilago trichophora TaxID=86804 RepID=A0A5C3EFZ1_9BASI|nr:uncharacterized protein UTRI_06119 [Ustilago trichophora]